MTIVVAVGGHLLAEEGAQSLHAALETLGAGSVVVTHGNGPQVGDELLRDPHVDVYTAVARTQGELGALLGRAVGACALVTHVVVDAGDPGFDRPTKPIGPVYGEAEARRLGRELGWRIAEDPGRGFRRVVASPEPRRVVELESVRALVGAGRPIVACGGGGIPVVDRGGRLEGVDAVIDKDRVSALLGAELDAERLVVLTDVDAVYRSFRTPREEAVAQLDPAQAEALLPELPEGSMRPKLEACAAFARRTGREALITSAGALRAALARKAGTRVAA
jgi:carbamate kinase